MSKRWLGSADLEVSPAGALSVHGLIPTSEQDMEPLVLADDQNRELLIPPNGVILLLKADGDFVEGQAQPQPSSNLVREAYVLHSIPVVGRSIWNIRRSGSSPVTIRGKVLLAD